ncbi:DUF2491 family protein [Pseudomonas sp. UFMG81]|uniref:DUF2491 family protein n=1 Tax=Pseudomonas sp. UFMG81 TaxID=2745936 RepID=UPI00188DCEF7|nr:DUF2491 family protein [Pseudomonas sp. UFMG81]
MSWLKRLMGFEAPPHHRGTAPAWPFGLRSGAVFTPEATLEARLQGYSELLVPGAHAVWAVGEVNLGGSVRLLRCYLDDEDYWLQVVMNGPAAAAVGDIILFGYHSVVPIQDEAHLKQLVGTASKVGLPMYPHDGYLYDRQWGHEQGQTELIPLTEHVASPEARYHVRHLSMLYARDTGLPGRREFLLLSVEEDEQGQLSLSTSLGVTLHPTDFHVT